MNKLLISLQRINKIPNYIYIFIFGIFGIIYFQFALTTKGYDDEFWTIGIIENTSWGNMLRYLQTNDIHPPLSYIFDRLIFDFLKNWNYVRGLLSIFLIASTFNLTFYIKRNTHDIHALIYPLFFLSNPAVLMWGTSLRWYTYFLIIFNWLLIIPEKNSKWFEIKLVFSILLLSLTGYITFIFIIPIFLYYYSKHEITWSKKFILISKNIVIYILLFSPQLFFFTKYHASAESSFDGNLFFPIKNLIVGVFSSFLSNQGVLPFSSLGILSTVSTTFLMIFCFRNFTKSKPISNIFIPLLISLLALIISGAAGYLRIFVTLTPIQSKWISDLKINKKKYFFPIFIILITQLYGIQNVISHSGTTKSYFNIPVHEVIQEIDKFANECGSKPIVFHHINALSFHLNRKEIISISHIENSKYKVSKTSKYLEIESPYVNKNDLNKILNSDNNKCAIVVDNFRGFNNFSYSTKIKMLEAMDKIKYSSKKIKNIGLNKNIFISKKIAKDYPKNSITLYKFIDPRNLSDMKIWINLINN